MTKRKAMKRINNDTYIVKLTLKAVLGLLHIAMENK